MSFKFEITARDGAARVGMMRTARGDIHTPAFMPVGTAGAVKALLPEQVAATGAEIVLANTYHLMLRPSAERVAALGGLHRFMNWQRPILTDSGGYQVMSLAKLRKIREEGVAFQSHLDGVEYFLSPERAMEIQRLLGSDIHMVLDECAPFPSSEREIEKSMALSLRWAKRSKDAFGKQTGRACFGIVQGGVFPELRERSAHGLLEIGFDGYAVGGLAVGEGQAAMFETLEATTPHLSTEQPRYLMGVGKPDDLIGAIARGMDMFDCVLPTRSGRNGQVFTWDGALNLRNARFGDDPAPLDGECPCPACRGYSRAYLSHAVKAGEIIAAVLLTAHNLTFYQQLIARLREAIESTNLNAFARSFAARYRTADGNGGRS
ncbi:MAG: tRNA guanosine(34) transglycosylase Tgt [Alphaproteobacteria bacterium]